MPCSDQSLTVSHTPDPDWNTVAESPSACHDVIDGLQHYAVRFCRFRRGYCSFNYKWSIMNSGIYTTSRVSSMFGGFALRKRENSAQKFMYKGLFWQLALKWCANCRGNVSGRRFTGISLVHGQGNVHTHSFLSLVFTYWPLFCIRHSENKAEKRDWQVLAKIIWKDFWEGGSCICKYSFYRVFDSSTVFYVPDLVCNASKHVVPPITIQKTIFAIHQAIHLIC